MPLTLDQYVTYLDTRDLAWPMAPSPVPVKAKPHLIRLPDVRAVMWNVYGTLLSISDGELRFEHTDPDIHSAMLEKTVGEFKMWASMARKPGQPGTYLKDLIERAIEEQRPIKANTTTELVSERIWENIVKKLQLKDYKWDAPHLGALNDYCKKIAYFFHASLQGTAAYPTAAEAVSALQSAGVLQGLLGDGQSFTMTQLSRGLRTQMPALDIEAAIPVKLRVLSCDYKVRKPANALMNAAVQALAAKGIEPFEVLHIGSSLIRDIKPARELGMRTALFAGDRNSLSATPDQLRDPPTRPDVMLTELRQVEEVVG